LIKTDEKKKLEKLWKFDLMNIKGFDKARTNDENLINFARKMKSFSKKSFKLRSREHKTRFEIKGKLKTLQNFHSDKSQIQVAKHFMEIDF
jgi:hypothetical protein